MLWLFGVLDFGQEYLQGSLVVLVIVVGNGGIVFILQSNGVIFVLLEAVLSVLAYYNDVFVFIYGLCMVEIIVYVFIYWGSFFYVYLQLDDDFLEVDVEVFLACFGQSDGMFVLFVFNGEAFYVYVWLDGGSGVLWVGFVMGVYVYILSDVWGCILVDMFLVLENDSFWVQINVVLDFVCGESGLLEGSVMGGIVFYIYEWEGVFVGLVFENVGVGIYILQVEDSLGCLVVMAYIFVGVDMFFIFDMFIVCVGVELAYEGQVYIIDIVCCDNSIFLFGCDFIYCISFVFWDIFCFVEVFVFCLGDVLEW